MDFLCFSWNFSKLSKQHETEIWTQFIQLQSVVQILACRPIRSLNEAWIEFLFKRN